MPEGGQREMRCQRIGDAKEPGMPGPCAEGGRVALVQLSATAICGSIGGRPGPHARLLPCPARCQAVPLAALDIGLV